MKLTSVVILCVSFALGGCSVLSLPASMYLSGVFIEASDYLPSEEVAVEELPPTQLQVECVLWNKLGFPQKQNSVPCEGLVHDDPIDVMVVASLLLSLGRDALEEDWYPQFFGWIARIRGYAEDILSFEFK